MSKDISIVIPAFNEEGNIEAAVDSVIAALKGIVDDYEIIVVDDCSRDRTGSLAEEKAMRNPKIRVLHNGVNGGYGYSFVRGIKSATKTYVCGFPGDNDMSGESLRDIVKEAGSSDLIISYVADMSKRTWERRFLSRSFVALMNFLFGLKLRYYNGACIFKRTLLQLLTIKSTGLAVIAECLVRMIKSGCTYKEVCFEHTGRTAGRSTALTLKSFKSVARTIGILIYDIHLARLFKGKTSCAISSSV